MLSFWRKIVNQLTKKSIGEFFFLLSFCICVSLLQGRYMHGVTYSRHSACMVLPGGLGFFKRWSTTPCIYKRTIDGVGTLLFIMTFIERIHFIWLKFWKLCSGERLILNSSFVVYSLHCILVINILIVNQIWKLINVQYEYVLFFFSTLCCDFAYINRSHLFVYREMMEGLHFFEKAILLLFMMYIYSEVKSKFYKF